MMTITLRIALILVSLGTFAMIMRKIRQSRMQIESAIFWIVLALVLGPLSAPTLENLFWFFTYHLTVTPVLILLPIFLLLGGLVPLAVYRSVARVSVVERLREAEG